jgi:hypothetical protein
MNSLFNVIPKLLPEKTLYKVSEHALKLKRFFLTKSGQSKSRRTYFMTHRLLATLLVMAILGVSFPASAGDLVSPKLLPPASALRVSTPRLNADFGQGTVPSDQPVAKHRHWSKTGKILTIVGAGLVAGGAAAIAHGQNTPVSCSGSTCASIAWRDTGIVWAAGGAALVVVGLTRHTTD